ncbi:MAG: FGGY-family carbohydrate kinase [Candidatus Hodarchaeota archaeon]
MDKENAYILAIDHGTSGAKTALVDIHGKVLDWEFEEVPLILSKGGGAEQDPDKWWSAICNTTKKLIDKTSISADDIVGICNTSQWSGTVPVDEDGNHLMNAIIWMDSRGAPYAKEFHKGLIQVDGYNLFKTLKCIKISGYAPTLSGKDPMVHIWWLQKERPDIYKNVYKFLEPQDYINLKLTGEFASSGVTMFTHGIIDIRDINNLRYHDGLIKVLGLERKKLPDLKRTIDILGTVSSEVADSLGLNKDTKVIMGAPDLCSATIGSGAVRDYEGHICIGTSSWLICPVPFKKTDIFHYIGTIPSAIPGKYQLSSEQEISGGCLSYLRDNILYHKDELLVEEAVPDVYKIFDKIVETVEAGSGNLIFTPWLYGERTPVDDSTLRAGLYNLSLETTREHIIRAVFEGVAYNARWLLFYIEKFIKRRMLEINMIGGGAKSDAWCQIVADVLNVKVNQVANPIQANAMGAAFIASVALGYIQWEDIPRYNEFLNTYVPKSENKAIYNKLFKEYVNIYKEMSKIYRRLNEPH